jgi:hypothetical protein
LCVSFPFFNACCSNALADSAYELIRTKLRKNIRAK